MTNNAILVIFAIVNVVVTALFAGVVLSQYARRHRASQLYWSIALLYPGWCARTCMVGAGQRGAGGKRACHTHLFDCLERAECTGDRAGRNSYDRYVAAQPYCGHTGHRYPGAWGVACNHYCAEYAGCGGCGRRGSVFRLETGTPPVKRGRHSDH